MGNKRLYLLEKADEEQKGEVLPQKGSHYSIVVKPLEFDSPERMNDYLLERGVEINIPLSEWMGWSLNRAELQNDILSTSSKEKVWNFASDDQTGTRYKYTIGPSGTEPQFLSWFYSKQNKEIRLNASLNIPVMPIFMIVNLPRTQYSLLKESMLIFIGISMEVKSL